MASTQPLRRPARLVLLVLVLALAGLGASALTAPDEKRAVAYFDSVTGIYVKDKVRILGMPVGRIEKITPEADRVRVEFSYDGDYALPADVKAAIVSPTLVATRYLQLAPAYTGGPKLPDNGEIPTSRTAAPLEFDDLKTELSRIAEEIGPRGGKEGALANFLAVAAEAGRGRGAQFHTMITELSRALQTLSEGRGDLFGTVRNLQVFITAMASLDSDMVLFNNRLAGVSDLLDSNGEDLTAAIRSVDTAARLVDDFLAENRPILGRNTTKLTRLTSTLAASRDDLATILHVGPNTLTNFGNIYSPRLNAITGALWLDNLETPGQQLCTLISQQLARTGSTDQTCATYLAPLLNQLGLETPPIGVGPPFKQPQPEQSPEDPGLTPDDRESPGLLGLLLPGGGMS